jgi:hypothetical protein
MVAFLSELNGLDLWATDIGNAYLEARMSELLFIIPVLNLEILRDICSLSIRHCTDFVPQAYAGMNVSQRGFETWASSLARPSQISG